MLASIQLSAQGTAIDSLKPYTLPIWKAWRIQRDLSTLDRQTALIDSAGKVIELKNVALKSAELTIAAKDSVINHVDNEAKACRSAITASDALHESQLKTEKKKGNKKGLAGVIVGIVITVLLL